MSQGGDAAKGAASGGLAGAGIGTSILPGWGTAIGAGIGGVAGGIGGWFSHQKPKTPQPVTPPTGDEQRAYLRALLAGNAPQMDTAQADATRGQQTQLAQMLFRQAQGQTPGAGEMAVNRQIGQANAAQIAQASMARGANAGMAGRNAARMQSEIGVNGAGQAGIAQMQDQANAYGQLGGLLGQTRQQDIGTAQYNQNSAQQQQIIKLNALAQMLGIDQTALGQGNINQASQLAQQQQRDQQLAAMMQQAGQVASVYGAYRGGQKPDGGDPYTTGPVTNPNQPGQFGKYTRNYV